MNVLLLSMPDSFEHMAPVAVRMPNGALTSIAGNVDPQHQVAVADLILVQGRVAATVDRLLAEHQPDVVGLSVMTFQRRTALRLMARIRAQRPSVSIVVGGYDPSLAPDAYQGVRRLHRPRRRRDHLPRAAARARARRWVCRHRRARLSGRRRGLPAHAGSAGQLARRDRDCATAPRRPRALRLHAARPPGRRHRDLARLHLRLQLLLDHRDARAELPHLPVRPHPRRHPRLPRSRAPARSSSSTTTSPSTCGGSRRCARPSPRPGSTISTTRCRRRRPRLPITAPRWRR